MQSFPTTTLPITLLSMRAEVIAIGDELTTGQRLDTNSQWLSQRLTESGVHVAFHTTVGDELSDNIAAFSQAIERAGVVVATGGLGPTADDLTREALAAATGVELVRDEKSLEHIQRLFERRGRVMPQRNEVQADFPQGSVPIPNQHGTAPGIEMNVLRENRNPCVVFALPGVPSEMHEMWKTTVAPRVKELQPASQVIRHRRIKCFGVGESTLESMLPDLIRRGREPRVGITVSEATITLRITATGKNEQECFAAMQPTVDTALGLLGTLVFGEEEDELEDIVVRLLAEQDKTIAVADAATRGLVAEWLTRASGERKLLSDERILSERQLAASLPNGVAAYEPLAAVTMAEEVRRTSQADIGLGIAAYPPNHESKEGRVSMALAFPGRTRKMRFSTAAHPTILRPLTAKQALNAVRLALLGDNVKHR